MADIQTTTNVALTGSVGVALVEYAAAPTWPPPPAVITIACGILAPIVHLIGRGIYRRVAKWAGPEEDAKLPVVSPASVPGRTVP